MQLHSAVTSSSSLTGTPDDVPQLPVGQAPGSPGAVTRSARLASLHRAPSWRLLSTYLIYILNQRLSVRTLFSGRSHEAQSASLAADRRPFSRSATGSTRSMPITPELRVHGSPPRRFCWPWLRGAGGKRRVKLGLSDSEATLRPGKQDN